MTKERKYDIEEVGEIIRLSELHKEIKYDGLVLVNPEEANDLVEAMKKYPTFFELQIGRLENQLSKEKAAEDLVSHLTVTRNPFAVFAALKGDIEYRKECVELYESLSKQKRKELLNLHI